MTATLALSTLESHLWESANILRGPVDAADFKTYISGDQLATFDCVIANPPFSLKKWGRKLWETDRFGRNFLGTPPQGRADYAFFQHILKSLKPGSGRLSTLPAWRAVPRRGGGDAAQAGGRGLGGVHPGPRAKHVLQLAHGGVRGGMSQPQSSQQTEQNLFINAANEVTRERPQSFLEEAHIEKIVATCRSYADVEGFARVVDVAEIRENQFNLSIVRYVRPGDEAEAKANGKPLPEAIAASQDSSRRLRAAMDELLATVSNFDLSACE